MAIPDRDNFDRRTTSVKSRLGAKVIPQQIHKAESRKPTGNISSRLRLGPAGLSMLKKALVPPPGKFMEEDQPPRALLAAQLKRFAPQEDDPNLASCSRKVPCRFWSGGSCRNGDSCNFSHDEVLPAEAAGPLPGLAAGESRVCRFWIAGRCKYGDGCKFSHAHVNGSDYFPGASAHVNGSDYYPGASAHVNGSDYFPKASAHINGSDYFPEPSAQAKNENKVDNVDRSFDQPKTTAGNPPGFSPAKLLQGHKSGIVGMAYDEKTKLLFTADEDNVLCAWETDSGKCVTSTMMDGKVKCMVSEAGWLFVAVGSAVKAWCLETNQQQTLSGTATSRINVLVADKKTGLLVAGSEDGKLACWSGATGFNGVSGFQEGHTAAVTSLAVASERLYSGSRDASLKVWDLKTGKCLMSPSGGHTGAVTGLLCWDSYLLSCSLDGSIKVWAASAENNGQLEVTFTLPRGAYGAAQALTGISDSKGPLLVCLYQSRLTLLELPSFEERGVLETGGSSVAVVSTLGTPGFVCSGESGGDIKQWSCQG